MYEMAARVSNAPRYMKRDCGDKSQFAARFVGTLPLDR